ALGVQGGNVQGDLHGAAGAKAHETAFSVEAAGHFQLADVVVAADALAERLDELRKTLVGLRHALDQLGCGHRLRAARSKGLGGRTEITTALTATIATKGRTTE